MGRIKNTYLIGSKDGKWLIDIYEIRNQALLEIYTVKYNSHVKYVKH